MKKDDKGKIKVALTLIVMLGVSYMMIYFSLNGRLPFSVMVYEISPSPITYNDDTFFCPSVYNGEQVAFCQARGSCGSSECAFKVNNGAISNGIDSYGWGDYFELNPSDIFFVLEADGSFCGYTYNTYTCENPKIIVTYYKDSSTPSTTTTTVYQTITCESQGFYTSPQSGQSCTPVTIEGGRTCYACSVPNTATTTTTTIYKPDDYCDIASDCEGLKYNSAIQCNGQKYWECTNGRCVESCLTFTTTTSGYSQPATTTTTTIAYYECIKNSDCYDDYICVNGHCEKPDNTNIMAIGGGIILMLIMVVILPFIWNRKK